MKLRKNTMAKKANKHRQHKDILLNSRRGLNVGGIVIPYWPSYWGGVGGGDVHHGQTTGGEHNDNNSNDSGSADTGAGADSSGQM